MSEITSVGTEEIRICKGVVVRLIFCLLATRPHLFSKFGGACFFPVWIRSYIYIYISYLQLRTVFYIVKETRLCLGVDGGTYFIFVLELQVKVNVCPQNKRAPRN